MSTSMVDKVNKKRKTPPQWSNLQIDLLLKISKRFNLADQIRFRYVCKNWLFLPLSNNRAIYSLLPCLLLGDNEFGELNKQIIYSRLFDFINEPLEYFGLSSGFETSEHGWVISLEHKWLRDENSFIFFCPLSKETVILPDFHLAPDLNRKIAISSYPTSKQCVFFIVFDDGNGKTKVATWKRGYAKWITSELHSGISDVTKMRMVCFQGDLYCFDSEKKGLFVYNVAEQFWKEFDALETQNDCSNYYLIESAGELLLLCFNQSIHSWAIYMFDAESLSGWVVKTSLRGRALFIGHKLISVPASGEFKHMADKIFYCDQFTKKSKFYDLIDGKSYDCEGTEYQMLAIN